MITLTPRLQAVAGLVPPCQCMADIGTDHGYVPLYLLQAGRIQRAVASDINEGPARRAEAHCKREQAGRLVSVRVGPGLSPLRPGEAEGAVIAGMGGLMICSILEEGAAMADTLAWFVLQPQNHVGDLRQWLADHGYVIVNEVLAAEKHWLYQVLLVQHGAMPPMLPIERDVGLLAYRSNDPLFPAFLCQQIQKQSMVIEGINVATASERSRRARAQAEHTKALLEELLWKYT